MREKLTHTHDHHLTGLNLSYMGITMSGEDMQKPKNRVNGNIWEPLREVQSHCVRTMAKGKGGFLLTCQGCIGF